MSQTASGELRSSVPSGFEAETPSPSPLLSTRLLPWDATAYLALVACAFSLGQHPLSQVMTPIQAVMLETDVLKTHLLHDSLFDRGIARIFRTCVNKSRAGSPPLATAQTNPIQSPHMGRKLQPPCRLYVIDIAMQSTVYM